MKDKVNGHRNDEEMTFKGEKSTEDFIAASEGVDFETILRLTGGFGRQQIIVFSIHCLLLFFCSAMVIGPIFLTLVPPDHWCQVHPNVQEKLLELYNEKTTHFSLNETVGEEFKYNYQENSHLNSSDEERMNFDRFIKEMTIPKNRNGDFDRCLVYDVDFIEEYLVKDLKNPSSSWPVRYCEGNWNYNYTTYYKTIASELNWICGASGKKSVADSMYFIGAVVGGPIFGLLGDAKGRKAALYASNIFTATAGTLLAFSSSYIFFCICMFLLGLTVISQVNVSYVLAMELVLPEHRNIVVNVPYMFFFTAGLAVIPWVAYIVADWRIFSLMIYTPLYLTPLTNWLIPESVRWMVGKGKTDDVIKNVKGLAVINKVKLTKELEHAVEVFINNKESGDDGVNFSQILKKKRLLKHIVGVCLLMISIRVLSDGHTRLSQVLKSDIFITMSVAGSLELPAALASLFLTDRIGRRPTLVLGFFVTMISESLLALNDGEYYTFQLIDYFFCKIVIVTVLNTSLLIPVEVLPTIIRSSGSSAMYSLAFAGVISTPFIVQYAQDCYSCGVSILCLVALGGCLTCVLLLPETAEEKLPDSLEDGENLGRRTKLFFCWPPSYNYQIEKEKEMNRI